MNYTDRNQMGYSDSTEQAYNQRQSAGKPFIYIRNIEKTYFTGDLPYLALKDISLTIDDGKITVILGPSGSGKSTLMNILGGIDYCDNGVINVDSEDISMMNSAQLTNYRMKKVGFVFQFYNLIPNLTVYENVELPLVYLNIKPTERNRQVKEVLEKVNMLHRANHLPQQLSGGQQQRVAIARAVVTNARLLLADEPTGNLDSTNGVEVMELLSTLNKQGTTIIIVTHSQRDAAYAHRIIRLLDGKIIAENRNRPMESDSKIEIL